MLANVAPSRNLSLICVWYGRNLTFSDNLLCESITKFKIRKPCRVYYNRHYPLFPLFLRYAYSRVTCI